MLLLCRRKLGEAGEGGGEAAAGASPNEVMQAALEELQQRAHGLERQNNRLRVELDAAKREAEEATLRMVGAQAAAARLQQGRTEWQEGDAGEGEGGVMEAQLLRIADLEREVKRLKQVSRWAERRGRLGGSARGWPELPASPMFQPSLLDSGALAPSPTQAPGWPAGLA